MCLVYTPFSRWGNPNPLLGEPKPPVGGRGPSRWGTTPVPSGRTHYPRGKRRERCFTSQSAAGLLCQRGMSLRCTCGLPTSFLRNGTERALRRRFHRGLCTLLLVHSRQTSCLHKSHAFLRRRLYQMPRQTSTTRRQCAGTVPKRSTATIPNPHSSRVSQAWGYASSTAISNSHLCTKGYAVKFPEPC